MDSSTAAGGRTQHTEHTQSFCTHTQPQSAHLAAAAHRTCVRLSLACLALPPALSPSTMKISDSSLQPGQQQQHMHGYVWTTCVEPAGDRLIRGFVGPRVGLPASVWGQPSHCHHLGDCMHSGLGFDWCQQKSQPCARNPQCTAYLLPY